MTRRTGAIAAVLTVLAVLVTAVALTSPTDREGPGSPSDAGSGWRAVAVDDAMVPAGERMAGTALVPFAPGKPGVAAGRLIRPGAAGELALWQIHHDVRWSGAQLGVPEPVTSVVLAGSDDLVAVAGSTWQDGAAGTYLITSTDRSTWHRAALPPEADRIDLSTATVVGDAVYALGEVRGSESERLLVVRGDQVAIRELPAPAPSEDLAAVGVAGDGTHLLVALRTVSGDTWSSSVLRSDDDGLTWSARQHIDTDPAASVSALVHASDGWLLVGSVPAPTDPTLRVPQAWSSSDGAGWAREQVDPPDGGWSDEDSQWFGSLATRDGAAAATVTTELSTRTSLYGRTDRRWSLVTVSDPFTDVEPSAQVTITPNLASWVVRQGARSSGVWEYMTVLPEWALIDSGQSTDPVHETTAGLGPGALSASRPMIESGATGWRTWSVSGRFVLDGQSLGQVDWPSPLLDKASSVFSAQRPGTDEVLYVGSGWRDTLDGLRLYGALTQGDGTASTVGGIATGTAPWVSGALGTRDGWVIVGGRRAEVNSSSDDEPVVWSSHDAVSWDEHGPDALGVPGRTGAVRGVCALPDGSTIAVGWTGTAGQNGTTAQLWTRHDDQWSTAAPVTGDGWFSGCASTPTGTLLTGRVGDDQLWFSADGTTWSPVGLATDATLGTPVALDADGQVSGGPDETRWLVAVGSVNEESYQGTVLWVSSDGRQWAWNPVPSRSPTDSGVVVPADGGPLVVVDAEGGAQAWQLTDAQTRFAALAAAATTAAATGSPEATTSTAFVP
ncbi:MAG: exo-alpha-sialidase [Cellulomonas sp.]|nr:exo-alpha-sialidase [Cellulomonas sp.]